MHAKPIDPERADEDELREKKVELYINQHNNILIVFIIFVK